jgi:hypothetical protein
MCGTMSYAHAVPQGVIGLRGTSAAIKRMEKSVGSTLPRTWIFRDEKTRIEISFFRVPIDVEFDREKFSEYGVELLISGDVVFTESNVDWFQPPGVE